MEETLIEFNPHWQNKEVNGKKAIRQAYLNKILEALEKKKILFLTGIRRIGKTTLMKQTINHLIKKKNVNPNKILFLSCDDLIFSGKTLFDIIGVYREINEIKRNERFYLFIDEVTYMPNFHQQLKNLHDSRNLKIFCSSSNTSHLNDRKAFLTGRTSTIEVYPLSYREYLEFRNLEIQKYDSNLNKRYFEEYLKHGGFPEYVIEQDPQHLLDIANSIIQKDIVSYYSIKDEKTIKELFNLLCVRIGKPTSYNKLAKILKIKPETVKNYVSYFEKTFMFFSCERFSKSRNEKITSPKKFYIIDNGLKNLVMPFEKGSSFENLVFINLYKNRNPLDTINYYLKEGTELDFITRNSLFEAKYQGKELTEKQKNLFKKIKRTNKSIIKDHKDIEELTNNGELH